MYELPLPPRLLLKVMLVLEYSLHSGRVVPGNGNVAMHGAGEQLDFHLST